MTNVSIGSEDVSVGSGCGLGYNHDTSMHFKAFMSNSIWALAHACLYSDQPLHRGIAYDPRGYNEIILSPLSQSVMQLVGLYYTLRLTAFVSY